MPSPTPPPGWYPDPDGPLGKLYWDGQSWTDYRVKLRSAAKPEPAERRFAVRYALITLFVATVLAVIPLIARRHALNEEIR